MTKKENRTGQVAVIGGGASGMMAAITAAQSGADVLLLEQNDRVGRKILSTGNGKCNYTNLYQADACYHSGNPSFPRKILRQFDVQKTVDFFEQLGISPKNRNGCLYPRSEQASSVLDVLRMECGRLKVRIFTETACTRLLAEKPGFQVQTNTGDFFASKVILAAGSRASSVPGSDGSGYMLAQNLGHRLVPVLPALVQLRCSEKFYPSIAGVRAQGKVSILANRVCVAEEEGELQLTNYGISGIPVFQVSGAAARALYQKRQVTAVLNFLPEMGREELADFLKKRALSRPRKTLEEFFIGLFPKKLCDLWIRLGEFPRNQCVDTLTKAQWKKLFCLIQQFQTTVTQTNAFSQAQVCQGGVDTREVSPETLESLRGPGLYWAGEILDVDGIGGGYNLPWAWASGHVAGREAAHA